MPKLAHVNIRTSDLEASVAFYRDVIGLSPGPAATRPDSSDHVWMSDDDANPCIHLQRTSAPASEDELAGLHHVAIACDDLHRWRTKLTSMSVDFREADFSAAELVQLNLLDPDGVRVELLFETRQ